MTAESVDAKAASLVALTVSLSAAAGRVTKSSHMLPLPSSTYALNLEPYFCDTAVLTRHIDLVCSYSIAGLSSTGAANKHVLTTFSLSR